ncbi:MAG: TonB-dependent receptor, partial [Dechloromonas sp.]|nr:TonB-dependent receptor [Dechloromonas sp.]
MQKTIAMAAMLAAAGAAQAADNADLAAIRAQIDEMKKSYEQRIATLEKKLAQAESKASAPVAAVPPAASEARQPATSTASGFNPEVSLILQGQYKRM